MLKIKKINLIKFNLILKNERYFDYSRNVRKKLKATYRHNWIKCKHGGKGNIFIILYLYLTLKIHITQGQNNSFGERQG